MEFIYVRVSTQGQQTDGQLAALTAAHPNAEVVIEKASGKDLNRPAFVALLGRLRAGDKLIVREMSRLGRSTVDVLKLLQDLQARQVNVVIKNQDIDTTSPSGWLIVTILAAVAQMERDIMLERQALGIAEAKKQGKFKGRQQTQEMREKLARAAEKVSKGYTKEDAAKAEGIGVASLYRYLKAQQTK